MSGLPNALVTDFDGTVTRHDFYKLAVERFLTPRDLSPWDDYRSGKITHFEAIRDIFARIRVPLADALAAARDMGADPKFAACAAALKRAGWETIIASAGCEWYVRRIVEDMGADVAIHANPGEYPEGGPLIMRADPASKFYDPQTGVGKAAIVRDCLANGRVVAYAGDGFTDEEAAMLAPPDLRFARADLADVLTDKGVPFRRFDAWSEVADALLARQ